MSRQATLVGFSPLNPFRAECQPGKLSAQRSARKEYCREQASKLACFVLGQNT